MLVPQDQFKDGKNCIEFGTKLNFLSPTSHIGHQHHKLAYNDVDDRIHIGMSPICIKMSPTYSCHQHLKMVTIMKSPTSLSPLFCPERKNIESKSRIK